MPETSPLIPAESVAALLDSEPLVLDARAGADASAQFSAAHVAGARHVNLETDLSELSSDPSQGGRHPLPPWRDWCRRVGEWGLTRGRGVFIYDNAGGGMAAARAWWMLRALGHTQVQVLNGRFDNLASRVRIESGQACPANACAPYPATTSGWPTVDFGTVRARDSNTLLIDARAPERFQGISEPIDPVAGHIPGARNLFWQSLLREDGTFLPMTLLRDQIDEALRGVSVDRVVASCGSGVTACHVLLAMDAIGYHGAALYVGSWSEWCRRLPSS